MAALLLVVGLGGSSATALRGRSFATVYPSGWTKAVRHPGFGSTEYALSSTGPAPNAVGIPLPGAVGITIDEYPISVAISHGASAAMLQDPVLLLDKAVGAPPGASDLKIVAQPHPTVLGGEGAAAAVVSYLYDGTKNVQSDVVGRHGDMIAVVELDTEPSLAHGGESTMTNLVAEWTWRAAGAQPPRVTAPPLPTPKAGGRQLLARAVAALDRARSFHLSGTWVYTDAHGLPGFVTGDFAMPGRMSLTLRGIGVPGVRLIAIGSDTYVRADAPFWVAVGAPPGAVPTLASHWVSVPAHASSEVDTYRALAQPGGIARCLITPELGSVNAAQRITANGRPAIDLSTRLTHSAQVADLFLPVGGPRLPSAISRFGAWIPSRETARACGDIARSAGLLRSYGIQFSRYNQPLRITAPASAVSLAAVAKAATLAPATANPGERATQEQQLIGTWIATGRILVNTNSADEHPGTTITRVWQINRRCANGKCGLSFVRTTAHGLDQSWLTWSGNRWTADFAANIPCTDGSPSIWQYHLTIEVHAGKIAASEQSNTSGACTGTGVVHWTATAAATRPA